MGNHTEVVYGWSFLRYPVTEHGEKNRCHLRVAVLVQLEVKALEGGGEGRRELAPLVPLCALRTGRLCQGAVQTGPCGLQPRAQSELLAVVRASACPRTPPAEAWGWRPELRKLPSAMPRWLVCPLDVVLPQGVGQASRWAEEPLVAV